MTPEQFKKEVEALGLTVSYERHDGGRTQYPYVKELGGEADVFLDMNRIVTVGYQYDLSFENFTSVASAILAAQAEGMPIIIDPIRIAGLAYNHTEKMK